VELPGLTPVLAIYAAAVSTVNVGWAIIRDRRDRGRLRVRVSVTINRFYNEPNVTDEMIFDVVNDGKRPAFVKTVGGIKTNGMWLQLPIIVEHAQLDAKFPWKLEPGESAQFKTPLLKGPISETRRLGVTDTSNRWVFAPAVDFAEVYRCHQQWNRIPPHVPMRVQLRSRLPAWVPI
jgi:hypothetical protein